MRYVEDIDPLGPGVRRFARSWVGEELPEIAEHIERVLDKKARERARRARIRHTDLPPTRREPKASNALQRLGGQQFSPVETPLQLGFTLDDVLVYDTGIGFDLVATLDGPGEASLLGDRVNVSSRAKATHIGRVYLGISLPSGRIVTNKTATPGDLPDDDASPWLYWGRVHHNSPTTIAARYFMSPLPEPGTVTFTIAYPEIGLDRPATANLQR